MSKYWSKRTLDTVPYKYGEQPKDKKYIKLNTNENPFPPSPKALERMGKAINEDLRLYPDPTVIELKEEIAKFYGVSAEEVFVGNGSDEVLAFSFLAFFDEGEKVIFPDITYSFYEVYAGFFGVDVEIIPLKDDFAFDVDKFIGRDANVLIANPNAPTGIELPLGDIEKIAKTNADRVVVLDEAYVDFGCKSGVSLLKDNPNILVCQTFSKSRALAGIRVGYAIGSKELIEGLERVKNSFNSYTIDRVALAGAIESVKDRAYFEEICQSIMEIREKTAFKLKDMGFEVLDSKANFLFARHKGISGKKIYECLKERGILVRHFDRLRIGDFLRITVGTKEEMDRLATELGELLKEQ